MTHLLWIPKRFFDDHRDRDLPTPVVIRETARHYFIRADDPALPELQDDARYYAGPDAPDMSPAGLSGAARALLKALKA